MKIGLFRVKSHLERLLNEKYQQSMAPTLKALEDICTQTELELSQVNNELQQHNIEVNNYSFKTILFIAY